MAGSSTSIRQCAARGTHDVACDMILSHAECKRVLDIPCGEGAFAERLKAAGVSVTGGDCTPPSGERSFAFAACNMNEPLPFEDASFDAVACIDGIEHIERTFEFVRECRRIVTRDGLLLMTTPNISALRSRWRYLLTGFHNKGKTPLDETAPHPLHHINLLTFAELRYLLHSNGFRISRIRTNRVKLVSWLYLPLAIPSNLMTRWVFRREEKDREQRRRNREIRKQMFSTAVLFGETLIVEAKREG